MPIINSSFVTRVKGLIEPESLISYLGRRFKYHTASEWLWLVNENRLKVDGFTAVPDDLIRNGCRIEFAVVDYDEPEVSDAFSILSVHGDLAFIHKPPGMPVHRTGKIFFGTLVNRVRHKLGDAEWSPLNRLDCETGGVVLFGRGAKVASKFNSSSPLATWTKLYAAVVRGNLPAESGTGVISTGLAEKSDSPIRCRMHVLEGERSKSAISVYRVLACKSGFSLLVLSPITGRKHQLRTHMAHLQMPVVGDKIYSHGGEFYLRRLESDLTAADYFVLGSRHHLLHAFFLKVSMTNGEMTEECDWMFDSEFDAYFSPGSVRDWFGSPERDRFLRDIENHRPD